VYITGLHKVEKTTSTLEGAKGVYKQIPLSKKDGVPTSSFLLIICAVPKEYE
jgi:hypothetical protein